MRCLRSNQVLALGLTAIIAALASPLASQAGPIVPAGSDRLITAPGTTFGGIPFTGVPLTDRGPADTIVQRLDTAVDPLSGDRRITIPIEIVALQLTSVNPMDLGPGLGEHRLFVTLDGPQDPGSMTIDFATETFTSILPVSFRVTIDALDGPIFDRGMDTLETLGPVPWDQVGGFRPGLGDPFDEQGLLALHRVRIVPEPSTLLLVGSGLAGCGVIAVWRRRRG